MSPVTILTSGVGLGTYVPAVLNQRALLHHGRTAEVRVIESYYTSDHLDRHLSAIDSFRSSLTMAAISQRMTVSIGSRLRSTALQIELDRWAAEGRREFIVWSGQWVEIIRRYNEMVPSAILHVDFCRIDAIESPSFRGVGTVPHAEVHDIWLWNGATGCLDNEISVTDELPIPFAERKRRILAHGGGWALGEYQDVAAELADFAYDLDIVVPPGSNMTDARCRSTRIFARLTAGCRRSLPTQFPPNSRLFRWHVPTDPLFRPSRARPTPSIPSLEPPWPSSPNQVVAP